MSGFDGNNSSASALTGSDGYITIASTGPTLQWASSALAPTIKQADDSTNSVTGQVLTIVAQSTTGTSSTGGNVAVYSGEGTADPGFISYGTAAGEAVRLRPRPTGSNPYITQSTVTSVNWSQNATTLTNGAPTSIIAQTTTLDGGTGGLLTLTAGSGNGLTTGTGGSVNINVGAGTTTGGNCNIQRGGTSAITITPDPTGTTSWVMNPNVTLMRFRHTTSSIATTGAAMTFTAQTVTTASGTITAGSVTINGGDATGASTSNTGGSVNLNGGAASGASSNTPGNVQLQQTNTTLVTIGNGGIQSARTSIAITTGTVTLTQTQYRFPHLRFTGTLSGNVIIVLPSNIGSEWTIDATAVALGGNTITLQANSNNWGTTIGTSSLYHVRYGGTGRLYGVTLTS